MSATSSSPDERQAASVERAPTENALSLAQDDAQALAQGDAQALAQDDAQALAQDDAQALAQDDAQGLAQDDAQHLLEEAQRLLDAAQAQEVPMRLLGGMAIRLLLGARMDSRFHRRIDDLDFITTRKASRAVEQLLETEGWEPERRFNALNGSRRLLFNGPGGVHKVDVFVESFQMCHSLPLAERIAAHRRTLPAAELVMTKLQIVTLNEKDRNDLYALLDALEVAAHDEGAINAARIAQLTGSDWGLHHTFELNLGRLSEQIEHAQLPPQTAANVARRIHALQQALEQAPKSRGWRIRAKIGERRPWYEEPEEVER